VLVTLATTGFLGALTVHLVFAGPDGFAPPALMRLMSPAGIAPAAPILGIPLILLLLLAATPPVRRRLAALRRPAEPGAARRAAPLIHGGAALIAAGAGILLAGYGGQAPLSAPETFTLPSLLALEAAGLTIGRRGGNPALLLLAVPMVTLLDMLMLGQGATYPARIMTMGLLLLGAITAHALHRRAVSE
jgi:hypothetical protein